MNTKEIIKHELAIWSHAYPDEAWILKRFANKLIFEVEAQGDKK
jgi:hypothetical protein